MSAWIPLSSIEDGQVWDRFYHQFQFRPSIYPHDWPGIREPIPSITFRVKPEWRSVPQSPESNQGLNDLSRSDQQAPIQADMDLEDGINAIGLCAFRSLLDPELFLYALDWNHAAYRFYPHREFDAGHWPIPVYLNGDYSIFLAKEFDAGTFWHPWEGTLCVFGPTLVMLMQQGLTDLFGEPLRTRRTV